MGLWFNMLQNYKKILTEKNYSAGCLLLLGAKLGNVTAKTCQ